MPYTDLRDYIAALEARGLLHVVDEPVCKDTELVPLVRLQFRGLPEAARRAFWFRSVTDPRGRRYPGSVALGTLGSSRAIYGAALGTDAEGIAARWAAVEGNHLARSRSGPRRSRRSRSGRPSSAPGWISSRI